MASVAGIFRGWRLVLAHSLTLAQDMTSRQRAGVALALGRRHGCQTPRAPACPYWRLRALSRAGIAACRSRQRWRLQGGRGTRLSRKQGWGGDASCGASWNPPRRPGRSRLAAITGKPTIPSAGLRSPERCPRPPGADRPGPYPHRFAMRPQPRPSRGRSSRTGPRAGTLTDIRQGTGGISGAPHAARLLPAVAGLSAQCKTLFQGRASGSPLGPGAGAPAFAASRQPSRAPRRKG